MDPQKPECHRSTDYRRRKKRSAFNLAKLAAKRRKENFNTGPFNLEADSKTDSDSDDSLGSELADCHNAQDDSKHDAEASTCQHLISQIYHSDVDRGGVPSKSSREGVFSDRQTADRGGDIHRGGANARSDENDIETECVETQHCDAAGAGALSNIFEREAEDRGDGNRRGEAPGRSNESDIEKECVEKQQCDAVGAHVPSNLSAGGDSFDREIEDCDDSQWGGGDANASSNECGFEVKCLEVQPCERRYASRDDEPSNSDESPSENDSDGSDDDDEDDDGDDDDGGDDGDDGDDGDGNDSSGDEAEENIAGAGLVGNFNFTHRRLQIPIRMFRACSVKEALAMVLAILSKHNSTYESIIDTCNVINVMLGRDYLPSSKKLLWSFLNRNNLGLKKHAYCKICHRSLGLYEDLQPVTLCCRRNWSKKKIPYFMEMSLKMQFSDFLHRPETRRLLRAKFEREKINEDALEDIFDSSNYKRLEEPHQPLAYEWNFSYTFNTDGLRCARFSRMQGWPFYVSINEARKGVRQRFMFLAAVWVGRGEPDMNLVMSTFVDQANELSLRGIRWTLDNEVITSKFIPTTCTVDAQARCKVLNCNSPAGYYACTFCTHHGVLDGGVKFPVVPHPEIEDPVRRTDASLKANMVAAAEQGVNQEGVHGPAAIMNLRFFDLGTGFSTDDLHPIYEGAVKDFMELILDDAASIHYIGQPANVAVINRRLLSIRPPTILSRTPREIDLRASWRGHEWRNWALYYSVPCMEGILGGRKMTLWKKLVRVLFLISRDSITKEDLAEGENLLNEYATLYQDTFGVIAMRFNIHILSHVIENIRLLGPPHVHSTFQFETWNLKLRKTVKSMHDPVNQIVNRFLIHRFVQSVPYDPDFSEQVQLQVRELLDGIPLKQVHRIGDVMLLGKGEQRGLSPNEQELFREKQLAIPQHLFEYKRSLQGRMYVKSVLCDDTILSDNTHLYLKDDTFCTVQSIARVGEGPDERCYLFVNVLEAVNYVQGMPHVV